MDAAAQGGQGYLLVAAPFTQYMNIHINSRTLDPTELWNGAALAQLRLVRQVESLPVGLILLNDSGGSLAS